MPSINIKGTSVRGSIDPEPVRLRFLRRCSGHFAKDTERSRSAGLSPEQGRRTEQTPAFKLGCVEWVDFFEFLKVKRVKNHISELKILIIYV